MPLHRRAIPAALLVVAGGSLAACSGDDPATTEGAEEAVSDYLDEMSDGDYDDACDFWTEEYAESSVDEWNETWGEEEPVEDCEAMLEQAVVLAEAFGESMDVEIDSIFSEETGDDTTRVLVDYNDDVEAGDFLMVYEDGRWLVDGGSDEVTED